MNKKVFKFLIPSLALSLCVGCGSKGGANSENASSSSSSYSTDVKLDAIPDEVLNYEGEIDVLVYWEGQNGMIPDIGSPSYLPADIPETVIAQFAGAAREFRRIAPGVKININYCSIAEYNDTIISYKEKTGHLPHIMHGTEHVVDMIANGYSTDLSKYSNSEYYAAFSEDMLDEFNFGGFQGAIPYMCYPMGVFVNTGILEDSYIEYNQDYIDNWTMQSFLDSCKDTYTKEHAGLPHLSNDMVSYSAPSIYLNLKNNKEIDLNTPVVKELIEIEHELTKYAAYDYEKGTGSEAKPDYEGIHGWSTSTDFAVDEKFTFNYEMPWNIGYISKLAEDGGNLKNFDILPYPAANETEEPVLGMIAEGLTIGNQCPIGSECTPEAQLQSDVAAYFAMFMNVDPRAVKAKSEILWFLQGQMKQGVVDLPMVKKDFIFSYEEEGATPVFEKQLGYWLNNYKMWWTPENEGDLPDTKNYTNLKPGFKKVLDMLYVDTDRRFNFHGQPNKIPDGATGTKEYFHDWGTRYSGDGSIFVGQSTWAAYMLGKVATLTDEINGNIEVANEVIQEGLDTYYGEGLYDIFA